ncbi:MAG TPA: protein kinase [Ktedonobacteraceae bacterium]|nr:protein kinase [Ktedonobacteraceae bacterium]
MKGIEGSTLGRYELRRRIGQGGMAEVYLAYDRRVRRQVAIKVLYGRDESFVRRFEREALAVGALSHNHILPLYDFGEQRPWYYLVMPYVEGGTLRDHLHKKQRLTLIEAASFVDQIASALQYAHDSGVIHRDVKPSNILLRPDGYAYLADFGLAKAILGAEALTSIGAIVGTPEYTAPEQSNGINDYRSDIYSLGVILYQMLTGKVPFTAESPIAVSLKHIQTEPTPPSQLNSSIPPGIEAVILKALAKDPDARYQQAQELSTAYWKALHHERLWTTDKLPAQALTEAPWLDHPKEAQNTTSDKIDDSKSTAGNNKESLANSPQAPTRSNDNPEENNSFHFHINAQKSGNKKKHAKGQETNRGFTYTPFPPSSPTRTTLRRSRTTIFALFCLILMVAIVPLGLNWQAERTSQIRPTQNTQQAATQHINTAATATAVAQATAQARLQATLAAQSRVQATAGITTSLGAGQTLYANSMTTPGGGWIDDGSQCYFTPQGYHVQTYTGHLEAWCYSNQQQYSNAIITVQAQLLRGDTYGLIFRLDPTARTFYLLELNSQGAYRFVKANGSNPLNWLILIDWTSSSAINPGYDQTNTFLILATGPHFTIYINKQLIVNNFTDPTPYSTGLLGLLVGGNTPTGTEAVFSNVWVFQK